MKLFTKAINDKLFQQYHNGSNLNEQMVVAKIFNPTGRGVWYLVNSDPNDPDYLWAIVDLFEIETGSVSRSELESIKVPPFGLPLERDLYFEPINAAELYKGLKSGKMYERGGVMLMKDNGSFQEIGEERAKEIEAEKPEMNFKHGGHLEGFTMNGKMWSYSADGEEISGSAENKGGGVLKIHLDSNLHGAKEFYERNKKQIIDAIDAHMKDGDKYAKGGGFDMEDENEEMLSKYVFEYSAPAGNRNGGWTEPFTIDFGREKKVFDGELRYRLQQYGMMVSYTIPVSVALKAVQNEGESVSFRASKGDHNYTYIIAKKKGEGFTNNKMYAKGGSFDNRDYVNNPITDEEKKQTYIRAYGKPYDSPDRKQAPLPLDIAYMVAVKVLEERESNGDNIDFRRLAKSKNFDIIVDEGRFEVELDQHGNPKYLIESGKDHRISIATSPIGRKYAEKIKEYARQNNEESPKANKYAKGGKVFSISELPSDTQELVDKRMVTYRGTGMSGGYTTRIRLKGMEYLISSDDFKMLGGIEKMRFYAPTRK